MSLRSFPTPASHVVAVVGGGFSGTLIAVQLARLAGDVPIHVVLFERGPRFARGVAYGTACPQHLLNVPAGLMSALVDAPGHFLEWLQGRVPDAHAGTFAPRWLYGEYLEELLAEAASRDGTTVELVRDEVVDLREEGPGVVVSCRGGSRVRADRVVLALGNPKPQDALECPDALRLSRKYRSSSWDEGILDGLDREDALVLIGSGLSAVDVVVEAEAAGHRGRITLVSRHGLLPLRHRPSPARAIAPLEVEGPVTARTVLRYVRREAARCEREGGDWRSAIDALRPAISGIWRAMSPVEKRRFVRHLGTRWDVHRHRIAPEIDAVLDASRREGRLEVVAGRIRSLAEAGDGVAVTLVRRGRPDSEGETLEARRVINCTGPARALCQGRSPLVDALIARGLSRTDPLALGLEAAQDGALLGGDGTPSDRLFALGPILKGQLWETTAVRELRSQAHDLARHLVAISGRPVRASWSPPKEKIA